MKPNVHIETWGAARENIEHSFRFNKRTMAVVALAGLAFPYVVYQVTKMEQVRPRPPPAPATPP